MINAKKVLTHWIVPLGLSIIFCFTYIFVVSANAVPETPQPGKWKGTTDQGYWVEFEVNETSAYINPFELRYDETCELESGEVITQPVTYRIVSIGDGGVEIIDNTFTSVGMGVITGTFSSTVSSYGSYAFESQLDDRYCYASGSWQAFFTNSSGKYIWYLPIISTQQDSLLEK